MSNADVFNPSQGLGQSMDTFRPQGSNKPPSRSRSRPGTQGTARFGALSHNAFFARHNPHPGRVRHIKGLLDVPICAVNDEAALRDSEYSLLWPPSNHEDQRLQQWSRYYIPSNSINVNTQLHPINTITGLQYFLGKPLNMRIYSEAIKPRKGLAEVPDQWEQELRAITEAVLSAPAPEPPKEVKPPSRQRTQYSATTGRLIPPPSRAMSRGFSRSQKRDPIMNTMAAQFNDGNPEPEARVMQILCQILQTDDMNAAKQWLVGAGEREKGLMLDMIRQALTGSCESNQYPQLMQQEVKVEGTIGNNSAGSNRLTLDEAHPENALRDYVQQHAQREPIKLPPLAQQPIPEELDRPSTGHCDVFRPPTGRLSARPLSVRSRPRSQPQPVEALLPETPRSASKLKYTQAADVLKALDEPAIGEEQE